MYFYLAWFRVCKVMCSWTNVFVMWVCKLHYSPLGIVLVFLFFGCIDICTNYDTGGLKNYSSGISSLKSTICTTSTILNFFLCIRNSTIPEKMKGGAGSQLIYLLSLLYSICSIELLPFLSHLEWFGAAACPGFVTRGSLVSRVLWSILGPGRQCWLAFCFVSSPSALPVCNKSWQRGLDLPFTLTCGWVCWLATWGKLSVLGRYWWRLKDFWWHPLVCI